MSKSVISLRMLIFSSMYLALILAALRPSDLDQGLLRAKAKYLDLSDWLLVIYEDSLA